MKNVTLRTGDAVRRWPAGLRREVFTAIVAVAASIGFLSAAPALADHGPRGGYDTQRLDREPIGRVDIDVWTDQGDGAVVHNGEPVRVFFRTTEDAYVVIYDIDTEGNVRLLYPCGPEDEPFVMGGRTYVVPSQFAPYRLIARGPEGVEYVEGLASAYPIVDNWGGWFQDEDRYLGDGWDNDEFWLRAGWIDGDPFVSIDAINRSLIPVDCRDDYFSADYTSFYIARHVPYPRYLIPEWRAVGCDPYYDPYPRVVVNVNVNWNFNSNRHHHWFRSPCYVVEERSYPKHQRYMYREGRVYDRNDSGRGTWNRGGAGSGRDRGGYRDGYRDGSRQGDDRYRGGTGDNYNRDWWRREKQRDIWNNRGSIQEIEKRRNWNHTWGDKSTGMKDSPQSKETQRSKESKGWREFTPARPPVEDRQDDAVRKDDERGSQRGVRQREYIERRKSENRIPERQEYQRMPSRSSDRGESKREARESRESRPEQRYESRGERNAPNRDPGGKREGKESRKNDGKQDKQEKNKESRGSENGRKSEGKGSRRSK